MAKPRKEVARDLRSQPTDAERILWEALRSRRLAGFKFRRQQALGPYVADFCCWESRLVVELDGGVHRKTRGRDEARSAALNEMGFRVLRFWNAEVAKDLKVVLMKILSGVLEGAAKRTPHPGPLPMGEGGFI